MTGDLPVVVRPFRPAPSMVHARDLARSFGTLALKAAQDETWLRAVLADVAAVDPHVRFLLSAMRPQKTMCAVLRSDYMHDAATDRMLQVELNTMACAFPALSTRVAERHGVQNGACEGVADALARAAERHGGCVLMVVRSDESNLVDQQLLVDAIFERGATCVRRTLRSIRDAGTCRDGALVLPTVGRVGVVYYRACYHADEMLDPWQRETRQMIEESGSVQCPCIALQLVGCKKVQQVLTMPGVVERFLPVEEAARVRRVFAGQWAADALPGTVRNHVELDPDAFVLKPQAEGGGNNVHGEDIRRVLWGPPSELAQYVLMERIRPPAATAEVGRGDRVTILPRAVAELGIYSVLLEGHLNEDVGWLLRVKDVDEREGGVCCGAAALAAPAF